MKQKLTRPNGHELFLRRLNDGSVFEAVAPKGKGITSYTGNLELALREALVIGHPLAKRILRSSKEILQVSGINKKMVTETKKAIRQKVDELDQLMKLLDGGSDGRTKSK